MLLAFAVRSKLMLFSVTPVSKNLLGVIGAITTKTLDCPDDPIMLRTCALQRISQSFTQKSYQMGNLLSIVFN